MSKYTAEQVEDTRHIAPGVRGEMLGDLVALLRERESAKAAVTDKMVRVAADQIWVGTDVAKNAPRMRRALKAVAPMLASARVPDGWQLVPVDATPAMQSAGGHANSEWLNDNAPIGENRYGGPVMRSVWQAMLAAAPKPKTEEN